MDFHFQYTALDRHGREQGTSGLTVATVEPERAFAMACGALDDEEDELFAALNITDETAEIRVTLTETA